MAAVTKKTANLKDILERVNENGESPLEVAADYEISKDTLRRRMKESGFVIDNSSKKYHKDGQAVVAADYDGMEIVLIRGKGNALKEHAEDTPKAQRSAAQDTHDKDTNSTRRKHEGSTSPFADFTQEDAEKLRMILDSWDAIQKQFIEKEPAAAVTETGSLQERRMQIDINAPRTRRAYTISDEVWTKFDEISDEARIQKGEALEIALLDFIAQHKK